jgi:hypothetical protein
MTGNRAWTILQRMNGAVCLAAMQHDSHLEPLAPLAIAVRSSSKVS